MSILYIVNGFGFAKNISVAGGDKRVVEIGKRLTKQGIKVGVLTTSSAYNILRAEGLNTKYYIIDDPFSILRKIESISKGPIFSYLFEILASIITKIPLQNYKIVYSSSDFLCDTIPAYILKMKEQNLKWVAVIHHLISQPWKRKGTFLVNFLNYLSQQISFRLIKNNADLIFVYSTPEGKHIRKYLSNIRVKKSNIKFVINGVDGKLIKQIPKENKRFAACFVGGLRPSKGIFDLIPIWKRICNQIRNAQLIIVGGGSKTNVNILKQEINENGLENNIIMTGPLFGANLFKMMKACKIFISPSYEEGWGIAVCEAMACGLPAITYNLPAYKIFEDLLIKVPVGNKEDFAKNIMILLLNDKFREDLSKKVQKVSDIFDWDIATEVEWKNLYKLFEKENK